MKFTITNPSDAVFPIKVTTQVESGFENGDPAGLAETILQPGESGSFENVASVKGMTGGGS
ncbi:MAG: hypothetical protein ABIT70_09065 [Sulfuriferula sp.]